MTTRFWNMEQDSRQVQDVIMEIINMPSNCVNRHQHLEPCVPHNTLHMSPQNVPEAPSYFQCRYDGAKSSITVDAPAPFIEWVYIDKIRVDHLVKANCTLPTIEQLMTIADYNFQDGFLSVDVTLVHRVNGTGSMDIPFGGGDNRPPFCNHNLPPAPTTPPSALSPPLASCLLPLFPLPSSPRPPPHTLTPRAGSTRSCQPHAPRPIPARLPPTLTADARLPSTLTDAALCRAAIACPLSLDSIC